jgi:hypothetical protein
VAGVITVMFPVVGLIVYCATSGSFSLLEGINSEEILSTVHARLRSRTGPCSQTKQQQHPQRRC